MKMKKTTESVPAEIVRYAKENKTDLIVVGSRRRSELEKLFLAALQQAYWVTPHAPCWL